MKLYRWQKECLKCWENNGCRGIVHVVTGAGKTAFAIEAVSLLKKRKPRLQVKVVTPTIPIAYQWEQEFRVRNIEAGFFGGGIHDDPMRPVMIYIINSARDYLATHVRRNIALGEPVLLICDECHHYQSGQNRKIFSFLTEEVLRGGLYYSIGLSATPLGTENDRILLHALGGEIYQYMFADAISDGIISPFTVCETAVSFSPGEKSQYGALSEKMGILQSRLFQQYPYLKEAKGAAFLRQVRKISADSGMDPENPATGFLFLSYQRKEVSHLARARLAACLGLLENLHTTDKVIVFGERIQQIEELATLIRRKLHRACVVYHSKMTKEAKQRALCSFRDQEAGILLSCRCLDEGIDVPQANIGIIISGSAVERQHVQRLGRVIRRSENKTAACLYYLYVRESADDSVFLPDLEQSEHYCLRYLTEEHIFIHELYEYAGKELLCMAERAGYTKRQLHELRVCIAEGLTRSDFLLREEVQNRQIEAGGKTHDRNYWTVMRKIGQMYHPTVKQEGEEI